MGINHMDEQQLKKIPKTIHVNRTLESEAIHGNLEAGETKSRKFSLDPLAPEDLAEKPKLMDDALNPLIKRELMLRKENAPRADGKDTDLTKMTEALDKGKYFDADEIAEKQWISRSMDSFVHKQEKEKAREEKRKAHEAEKEKRAKAAEKMDQEAFASEHTVEKNSSRLYNMIAEARSLIGVTRDVYQLEYIPSKELMVKDYKGAFSDKLNDRKRMETKKNKRSRLFQKIRNEELLKQAERESEQGALGVMEETVNAQKLVLSDEEAYRDLSQFLVREDKEYNLTLLRKYIGNNENKGPGGREGQDIQAALDIMAQSLFTIDINSISFQTDADMIRNASVLESLSNRVAAFDRMATKHHYMDNIEGNVKDMLEERLQSLRSIAAYYNIRKEIIKNPYYRDHYNEELSMDTGAANTPEQKKIAELLNRSYILGQTMMRLNGVDKKRMERRAEPNYNNRDAKAFYERMKAEYNNPNTLKELVSKTYSEKTTEAKKSMESTMPYDQKERKDRISQNNELFETAMDNVLAYKGNMRQNTVEKDAPYSEEILRARLEELEKLDIHEMKCESIPDIIHHYHENMKLCEQAEDIHFELVRGVERGFKLSDEDAKRIRAKLTFFHSIRNTITFINSEIAIDNTNLKKTDEEWNDYIKNLLRLKKFQGPVFLPGAVEELVSQCEEKVNKETIGLDDKIKHLWKYLSPSKPAGEVPPEEITKRKERFQSNAITAEFLDRQIDIRGKVGDMGPAVLRAWCRKNGKKYHIPNAGSRTIMGFLKGKPADEMIRLYKLITGTAGEQYMFWREVYNAYNSIPVEQFSANPRYKMFDEFYKKQAVSLIGANLVDVADNMAEIYKNQRRRGWLKLPEGIESIEELQRDGDFKYNFCCNYISGPLDGLLQLPATECRSLISMEEMGSFSDERLELINRRLSDAQAGEIEGEDIESQEFEDIYKVLHSASNFVQQEIRHRRKRVMKRKRSSMDMDLTELEKEERNELHAKEKKYLDKYNEESDRICLDRSDALYNVYENEISKDSKKYMSINPVSYSSVLGNMSYFQGTTEKETIDTFKRISIRNENATKEEIVAKRVEYEKILKFILDFDLKLFSFDSMDDLLSMNNIDLRQMCRMMRDFNSDEILSDYTELRDVYWDADCTMDKETIQLIARKVEFIKGMAAFYDLYPRLKGIEGFDPDNFLDLSTDEITTAMKKVDPVSATPYQLVMTVAFYKNNGFAPPVDAEKVFEVMQDWTFTTEKPPVIQEEIKAPRTLRTQRKWESTDPVDIEKEERRYKENDLCAKEKEYLEKYDQESERIYLSRYHLIHNYTNDVIRHDPSKRYLSVNPRKYSTVLSNMAYFQGATEEESLDIFKKMAINNENATTEERVAKRVEYEKILKFILDFDMKKLSFNSMDDLLSMNNLDLRQICRMMYDFDNDTFLGDYSLLRDQHPDAGCTMDKKTIQLIAQKNEFIKGIYPLYSVYPKLMAKKGNGYDPDQLLKLSHDEIMKLMPKNDPPRGDLYIQLTTVKFALNGEFKPPVNAEKLFEEQLRSGKLMTAKNHIW